MFQATFPVLVMILVGCSHTRINPVEMNDVHSKLNKTSLLAVFTPASTSEIQEIVRQAKKDHHFISISGGRHSMGGQQFGAGTIHLSMSSFHQVLGMDAEKGIVEVQSGIQWPELIEWLMSHQKKWAIRQKQTGADRLSLGGALSSNIHGRGLKMRPMIDDVESFTLIDANGELKTCSRTENKELFNLVIGGYGLFGVIGTVKLRLAPVTALKRLVRLIEVKDFIPSVTARTKEGFLYGDFQFDIDPNSAKFMKRGIYSLYKPVTHPIDDIPPVQNELSGESWTQLLGLAHNDKTKAFEVYSKFYISSDGQLYRSDTHQTGVYIDDYHQNFSQGTTASEMISEIYVPRTKLAPLFARLREDFRKHNVNIVYGTVRLIEKDDESFLAWAKQDYAATVFNFHVDHTPEGLEKAKHDFRLIIDRALEYGGSYFLTYHRWATKEQVLKAYPQMPEFLKLKKVYDPEERFQSDWYRHYREMFASSSAEE